MSGTDVACMLLRLAMRCPVLTTHVRLGTSALSTPPYIAELRVAPSLKPNAKWLATIPSARGYLAAYLACYIRGFVFDLARSRLMEHEWREEFVLSLSHPPPTPYQRPTPSFQYQRPQCAVYCPVLTLLSSYAYAVLTPLLSYAMSGTTNPTSYAIFSTKSPVCYAMSDTNTG
eukprot:3081483-Rhodomonas_salina.2